ncbi:hypothetical protein ABK040_006244 [Willaertia magna]
MQQLINNLLKYHNHLKFTFYHFPPSTCSWRVRCALYFYQFYPNLINNLDNNNTFQIEHDKNYSTIFSNNNNNNFNLNIEFKNISLIKKENEFENYLKINETKQVPSLVISTTSIHGNNQNNENQILFKGTQSLPLIEFLNDLSLQLNTHLNNNQQQLNNNLNNKSLIPKDNLLKYKSLQISEIINSGIQPLQNIKCLRYLKKNNCNEMEWSEMWIRNGLQQIESILLLENNNKYGNNKSVGNEWTIADICLIPQIEATMSRTRINVEKEFPNIFKLYNELKDEPIFKYTHQNVFK